MADASAPSDICTLNVCPDPCAAGPSRCEPVSRGGHNFDRPMRRDGPPGVCNSWADDTHTPPSRAGPLRNSVRFGTFAKSGSPGVIPEVRNRLLCRKLIREGRLFPTRRSVNQNFARRGALKARSRTILHCSFHQFTPPKFASVGTCCPNGAAFRQNRPNAMEHRLRPATIERTWLAAAGHQLGTAAI